MLIIQCMREPFAAIFLKKNDPKMNAAVNSHPQSILENVGNFIVHLWISLNSNATILCGDCPIQVETNLVAP